MSLQNFEGEREATTINSMAYGKKVIELMELRGYYLLKDSNIDGIFQDKIFKRPNFDGNRETVVEIKDTKLSLSDKEFLVDLGAYFLLWVKQKEENRFFFVIFASKLQNFNKWKSIFDEKQGTFDEVQKLMDDIIGAVNDKINKQLKQHNYDLFYEFINQCEIIQSSYDGLLKKIEIIRNEKLFDNTEEYLDENVNLIYKPEILTSNIYQIAKFPEYIFSGKIKNQDCIESFWRKPDADQYVLYKNMLFSTSKFTQQIANEFLDPHSVNKTLICDLGLDATELVEFKMKIIKSYIISKGVIAGYWYNRKEKCLHYTHINFDKEHKKKRAREHKLRWVVKVVYRENGEVYYVEHRGLIFNITKFNNDFYVIFNSKRYFSNDGKRLMDGENAKRLHEHYSQSKTLNDSESSKLDYLVKLLDFRTMHPSHASFISIIGPIKVELPCYSQTGEVFEDDDETYYNPTLDYFGGTDNDA